MTTENGPVRTKRQTAVKNSPSNRSATSRLRKQAREVAKEVQALADIENDALHEGLDHVREKTAEYCEQGQDQVRKVERTFEQYIRERPFKSILISAGVGWLLGRFWKRR